MESGIEIFRNFNENLMNDRTNAIIKFRLSRLSRKSNWGEKSLINDLETRLFNLIYNERFSEIKLLQEISVIVVQKWLIESECNKLHKNFF